MAAAVLASCGACAISCATFSVVMESVELAAAVEVRPNHRRRCRRRSLHRRPAQRWPDGRLIQLATAAVEMLAGHLVGRQTLAVAIVATAERHRMAVDRHWCAMAMVALAAAPDTETGRSFAMAVDMRLPTVAAAAVFAAAAGWPDFGMRSR